jgi:hypothetical protein
VWQWGLTDFDDYHIATPRRNHASALGAKVFGIYL